MNTQKQPRTELRARLLCNSCVHLLLQSAQSLRRVHIGQLFPRNFHQKQTVGMRADDGIAAMVLRQRQQLAVEFPRKDVGIAAFATVRRADDAAWVLPPLLHDTLHRGGVQQRLIGDHV